MVPRCAVTGIPYIGSLECSADETRKGEGREGGRIIQENERVRPIEAYLHFGERKVGVPLWQGGFDLGRFMHIFDHEFGGKVLFGIRENVS